MWNIFQKIGDGLKSVAHAVGDFFSSGYKEVKDVASGAADKISTQVNKVTDAVSGTVNHVISEGSKIITNTEDSIKGIISTPLMLIAGGLGLFLVMNGRGITDTAQVAIQKY